METFDKISTELDWALPSLNVVVEFHNDVTEAPSHCTRPDMLWAWAIRTSQAM
jgi:hypothetical protein